MTLVLTRAKVRSKRILLSDNYLINYKYFLSKLDFDQRRAPTVGKALIPSCKGRYVVLFQIRTFPPEPEDEAHTGPTATYDEVIYPGFQHDITALQIQGYTSHTIGIQVPEYNTTAEDTCLRTDYKQCLAAKGKTHQAHIPTGPGSSPVTAS